MSNDIRLEKVTVKYGEKTAINAIDLCIPSNRVTVLIGPSGCGKSTTLRSINRLVKIKSGNIFYKDEDVQCYDPRILRLQMGYSIQSAGLIPHLSVEENVSLVPRLLGWSKDRQKTRSHELLRLVGLEPDEYAGKFPSELSGGEEQRTGVARALGADPPVLLMDEPFGSVDPLNREILQDEFIRIQRKLKKTVLFITHDLEEAVRLADHLVIMKDGNILQSGIPSDILASPSNEFVDKFLGPDRALKRLTLFTADQLMKSKEESLYNWILDNQQRPSGGEIRENGNIRRYSVNIQTQTVRPYSSLKECMARILSLGMPAVPVVDEQDRFAGEVRYEDIQRISLQ